MKHKTKHHILNDALGIMTNKRIMAMDILDSSPKQHTIRFLYEQKTRLYFVFCGRYNTSFYTRSYQMAERHFKHLVSIS